MRRQGQGQERIRHVSRIGDTFPSESTNQFHIERYPVELRRVRRTVPFIQPKSPKGFARPIWPIGDHLSQPERRFFGRLQYTADRATTDQ